MLHTTADVRNWAHSRLAAHREKLESSGLTEAETTNLRGRIAEGKELLVTLDEKLASQTWTDASEI